MELVLVAVRVHIGLRTRDGAGEERRPDNRRAAVTNELENVLQTLEIALDPSPIGRGSQLSLTGCGAWSSATTEDTLYKVAACLEKQAGFTGQPPRHALAAG